MLRELTKKFIVVQRESFMLHDMKLFWYPNILESFLLLNTQFFYSVHIVSIVCRGSTDISNALFACSKLENLPNFTCKDYYNHVS
jgi:hypothetical protein